MSIFGALLTGLSGYYLSGFFLTKSAGALMRVSLSAAFGMGAAALAEFWLLVMGATDQRALLAAQIGVVLLAWGLSERRIASKNAWLRMIFLVAALWASSFVCEQLIRALHPYPHGSGLDVWSIWKFKARILFRDTAGWKGIFSPEFGFSHRDYPLLYPLTILAGWLWQGSEVLETGAFLSSFVTASCLLLSYSLYGKTGRTKGWLSALLLLSTPHFIGMGASQYADIIVAYYLLAAGAMVIRGVSGGSAAEAAAAGFFAGCAAFTKNEGLLFLAVAGAAYLILGKKRDAFLAGALPWIITVAAFKIIAHSPSEYFHAENIERLSTAPELWHRSHQILSTWADEFRSESNWAWSWFFIAGTAVFRLPALRTKPWRAGLVLITGMLAGYFGIYLLTPEDLPVVVPNSFSRLLLQIFPLSVYWAMSEWASPFPQRSPTASRIT